MTVISIFYLILAVLGLSFLVFIHELGHYFMARRLKMRVEVFSVGFGQPIYKWVRDGVNWQIGWIPFGGYVKVTGMDMADKKDIYDIEDGFYSKRPFDRILVALMGPIANIAFTLLAFTAVWMSGGREKNFTEHTHKIGWIDPKSELFIKGVRPGDEITSYNDQPYASSKDHLAIPTMAGGSDIRVQGFHVNPQDRSKTPFNYTVKPYVYPKMISSDIMTVGILEPASYVRYGQFAKDTANPLPEGSPLQNSGIKLGDRLIWADGVPVYSSTQLTSTLNDHKALLTIKRGQDVLLRRVPRVYIEELKMEPEFKAELTDWQFEAELTGIKFQKLLTIPYNLNNNGLVEGIIKLIDTDKQNDVFSKETTVEPDALLQEGDIIIAVDGFPVKHSYEILSRLQNKQINIIVERDAKLDKPLSWQEADQNFDQQYRWEDLQALVSQIGLPSSINQSGNLYLLTPVVPKTRQEMMQNSSKEIQAQQAAFREEIEKIEDPVKRHQLINLLDEQDKQLLIGLPAIQDLKVEYNPNPFDMFLNVTEEIWHTLKALVTGSVSPKLMSGPLGIVKVMHDNSKSGIKEALFWLGAISLNLGLLNLLPLPVLDGGAICFALYEMITGRRLKAKTLEKLIIPFAILLMGFFIFITYHDLVRILGKFF